jgi:hypothetical protein
MCLVAQVSTHFNLSKSLALPSIHDELPDDTTIEPEHETAALHQENYILLSKLVS